MKTYLVYALFLVLVTQSCITHKNLQKVGYPFKREKVNMKIPKGYTFFAISGGEEPVTFVYVYNDSSIIYITNDNNGGLNSSNISKQKGNHSKLFNASLTHDSLSIQGVDENQLNWKYFFSGKFGVGYLKVGDNEKTEFDQILNSAKFR